MNRANPHGTYKDAADSKDEPPLPLESFTHPQDKPKHTLRAQTSQTTWSLSTTPPPPTMIPSRNKRRLAIGLYHRNKLSLGESRTRLNYSAYHWGILIRPKFPDGSGRLACDAYDATDMSVTDPINHVDLNPNHDWFFRAQHQIDPHAQGRLIGCIIVGKLPKHISDATIEEVLRKVPLPVKDASPRESCVTWALAALGAFQREEWARQFDTAVFKDWARSYGDQCMQNLGKDNVCEYPSL